MEEIETEELTELQIEVALSRKLQDKRDKAIVKITLLLDYCDTIGEKEFLSNKLNEFIKELK